jgi:hypothetical protein
MGKQGQVNLYRGNPFTGIGNHVALAQKYGIGSGNNASGAIDNWISQDCGLKK